MDDRNYPPKRWVWLTALIRQHGWKTGVEVGVKEGENLFYLLEQNPALTMYGVDPWVEQPGEQETYAAWNMDDMASRVAAKAEAYGSRCQLLRKFSTDAARLFASRSVDFVFIDAQHTYGALLRDIAAWRDKCRFLAGHDYWAMFPGIEQAVKESFPASEIILGPNTCWAHWEVKP